MAWGASDSPVPYHPLVAPELAPTPHIAKGDMLGGTLLNAFVSRAIASEKAQLDQQQLIQNADLAAKGLALKREDMLLDHDIQSRNLDLQSDSYDVLNDLRRSSIDLNKEKTNQLKTGIKTALQSKLDFTRAMHSIRTEAQQRFSELGVDSPELQTKDPIAFSDAVTSLWSEFGTAPPTTGIPQRIRELQHVANQQKNTIVLNGEKKNLAISQILAGLRDPDTHDAYYQGLKEAGHIGSGPQDTGAVGPFDPKHPINSIWNKMFQKHETKSVEKPDEFAKKVLNQSKIFDPGKVRSRVPADTPRSATEMQVMSADGLYDKNTTKAGKATPQAVQEAADALNNGVDLPVPEPAPTDTDMVIQQAKMAIAQGKDPNAVRQILTNKGIDASALDEP